MVQGNKKGSQFERQVCSSLSYWWAGKDDVFWRSSQSGGRAKSRGRKGKDTHGQYGDVCAIDPIGAALIDFVTIELKRGYSSNTLYDAIDKSDARIDQKWEQWIRQSHEDHLLSGTFGWWIISKRDRRQIMITMPAYVYNMVIGVDLTLLDSGAMVKTNIELEGEAQYQVLICLTLTEFMRHVSPATLRKKASKC